MLNKFIKILSIVIMFSIPIVAQSFSNIELDDIDFNGNLEFSSSTLENVIQHRESSWWFVKVSKTEELRGVRGFFKKIFSFGAEKSYLDTLTLNSEILRLKNFYWANGFFEVKISCTYKIDRENKTGQLIFDINEKEPAYLRNVKLNGLNVLSKTIYKKLEKEINLDTTEQYSEELIEKNRTRIMQFLGDRGRMFVSSEAPQVFIDTVGKNNKVDIELNFNLGKRYSINEVKVEKRGEGKNFVEEDLLKKIVGIKPGNTFSFYDLQMGQVRLYRTDLFTSVSVSAIKSDTVGNKVPIIIDAEINKLYELAPELIFNYQEEQFNFGFGIGFVRKNFLGNARKLAFNISLVSQNLTAFLRNLSINNSNIYGYGDARLSVEQPFLFGRTINTKFETYFTHQIRKNTWNANIWGSGISFDFELPRYTFVTSLSVFTNYERSNYLYTDEYVRETISKSVIIDTNSVDINQLIQQINKTPISDNIVLGVKIGVNKTSDFLFPTSGYKMNILLEDGNSLSYLVSKIGNYSLRSPVYYKILWKNSAYIPLNDTKTSVFAVKFNCGHIQTYKGNREMIPLNRRFYVGGSNSVRGWETRALTPLNHVINYNDLSKEDFEAFFRQELVPGGFFLLEGSFETRIRLLENFGSAVFVDYGNTWNSHKEFQFDGIAIAAGLGFRYYSPFAPIRFDFAFKVSDPYDRRNFFEKNIWNTFEFQIGIGEAF